MDRRRLFFDCETSPNIGVFWRAGYKERIDYQNIIKERAIICIAYKWENEKKVSCLTWDDKQDDRKMLLEFVKVANEATELVGHNGDRFDLKWIRTRCLYHGIPMFPKYVTIDTLKAARSQFLFNSNRLDYIASYLGIGKKIETGFDLWRDILLKNDQRAMAKMVKYCKHDVVILQEVFARMNIHLPAKQHHGVLEGLDRGSCPECGGHHIQIQKTRTTQTGLVRHQGKCMDCGKYKTINGLTAR